MKVTPLGQKILIALSKGEDGEFYLASQVPELLGDFFMKPNGIGRSASILARSGLVVTSGESPNRYKITPLGKELVDKGFPDEEEA